MHYPCPRKSAFLTIWKRESIQVGGDAMKKIRKAFLASAVIGATALTTLTPASAWWGRPGPFFWGGVAAAVITGAVVGGAPTMGRTPMLTRAALPCGTAMLGYAAATNAHPA
jgi:hypothetical protein